MKIPPPLNRAFAGFFAALFLCSSAHAAVPQALIDSSTEGESIQPQLIVTMTNGKIYKRFVKEDTHWTWGVNANGGTSLQLNRGPKREALMKFDLSGITGTVASAVFSVRVNYTTGYELQIWLSGSDSWDQWTVHRDNMPGRTYLGATVPQAGEWVDVIVSSEVASALAGDHTISFFASTENVSDAYLYLDSQESGYLNFDYSTSSNSNAQAHSTENLRNSKVLHGLALMVHEAPGQLSTGNLLAKDRLLLMIREMIKPGAGNEPDCSGSIKWTHSAVAQAIALLKNAENGAIWNNELIHAERTRLSAIMEAFGYAASWFHDDANNFFGDIALNGFPQKKFNPNISETYVEVMIAVSHFFGKNTLNTLLANYDHNAFETKVLNLGLTNIYNAWIQNDPSYTEYDGTLHTVPGNHGSGYGIVSPFQFSGVEQPELQQYNLYSAGTGDRFAMYYNLAMRMYSHVVTDTVDSYGYMVNPVPSPYLGKIGMVNELDSGDSGGLRTSLSYSWDGLFQSIQGAATLIALGEWGNGVSSRDQKKLESRIFYGMEDFKHKATQGWHGRLKGFTETLFAADLEGYDYTMAFWESYIKPTLTAGTATVTNVVNGELHQDLQATVDHYPWIDRTSYTFTQVPSEVASFQYIRTRKSAYANAGAAWLSFNIDQPATIYYANYAGAPNFLSTWTDTGLTLTTSNGKTLQLYSKSFDAGTVTLPGNLYDGGSGTYTYIVLIGSSAGGGGFVETYTTNADTYLSRGYATTNYGTNQSLEVKDGSGFSGDKSALVKFDVSGFAPNPSQVLLVLKVEQVGTEPLVDRPIDLMAVANDSWSESGVTWNNQPSPGANVASFTVSAADIGAEIVIDVTAYVNGEIANDGTVSFALTQPESANGRVKFYSRESNYGFGPYLEVYP